jgi:arsenite methyltransferase
MNDSQELKSCCAAFYQSDLARAVLGDSFHPGGLALTARLGDLLELLPGQRVLDVAAGNGQSAVFLAERFGCEVVGVDLSADNVARAAAHIAEKGLTGRVQFRKGDAESLYVPDGDFDAVVCECAFCTFPDKAAAAAEFVRVLRPGGRAGLSDLTRTGALPAELESLFAWIACVADAQPVSAYARHFEHAGCRILCIEPHDEALAEMVREIKGRLLGAELLVKLKKLELPGADFEQARQMARAAADAIRAGVLGYTLLVAQPFLKSETPSTPETVRARL